MIILMKKNATQEQIDQVTEWIASVGYKPHLSQGVERTLIGAIGDDRGKIHLKAAAFLPGVEKVVPILKPYKLAGREFQERQHGHPGRRGPDRRRGIHRHGRSLLRRERGAADGVRLRRQEGGGEDPPGRRLQAADVALQLPGNGGGGAEAPQEGRRKDGDAGGDRGDEHDGRRPGRGSTATSSRSARGTSRISRSSRRSATAASPSSSSGG